MDSSQWLPDSAHPDITHLGHYPPKFLVKF